MKYKYRKRKNKKVFSKKWICVLLIIFLLSISFSYSKLTKVLTINGTVTGKDDSRLPEAEVVAPDDSGGADSSTTEDDRLTTNTNLKDAFNREIFVAAGDELEGNMVTTKIKNGSRKAWGWLIKNVSVTFELTIKNNSGDIYTDGTVDVCDETDPNDYITSSSKTLSATNVASGDTVTLTVVLSLNASKTIPTGNYITYKITFNYKGNPKYYYYKILISG